jgi:hypothetical protein
VKRTTIAAATAAAILVLGACAPDDDQVDVQPVDEVQTPAPVMPEDTMMMHDTIMPMDTLGADPAAPDTIP